MRSAWVILGVMVMAASGGCGKANDGAASGGSGTWPWVDPKAFYHAEPMPGVPVIRVPEAPEPAHDGTLDDPAWKLAREFHEFAYPSAMGLSSFPTSVRMMKHGRILWLGLDLRIPPGRDGKVPEKAMNSETVEIWLDRGPTRYTFYQFFLKPDNAITSNWIPKSTIEKGFLLKTRVRPDGWTAEIRVDIDAMDDFGPAPGPDIGFNMARTSMQGWASLAQIVGHVHKITQYWTLDMTGHLAPVEPVNVYRDPFKPGTDVRAVSKAIVDEWAKMPHPRKDREWARMEVMVDRLRRMLVSDAKSPWGREGELSVCAYRVLTGFHGWLSASTDGAFTSYSNPVLKLGEDIAEYPGGTYPKTNWREEVYVSDFDNTPQPYTIRVPMCYDAKKPIPLVVFMHGSGVDHWGGGAIFERYEQEKPVIEVRTSSRQAGWYGPLEVRDVLDVIEDVRSQYNVDPDRIYLSGYSAGAYSCFTMGAMHPEQFAALVPIAGSITCKTPETLGNMPILLVYAVNDFAMDIMPDTAVAPIEARAEGSKLRMSVIPATGHGVPLDGFEPWMLQFKRAGAPKSVSCFTDEANPIPVRNYWASILSLRNPDSRAAARADVCDRAPAPGMSAGDVVVQTGNAKEFSLDLRDVRKEMGVAVQHVAVDGTIFEAPRAPFARFARKDAGPWTMHGTNVRPKPDPTEYHAGGIENLYSEGSAIIVAPADLVPFADNLSHRNASGRSTWISIPVRKDTEVTDDELRANHLILLGGPAINKVAARLAAMETNWPLPIDNGTVVFSKKERLPLAGKIVTAVTFNPMNRARRVWAIVSDSKDAFRADSALLSGHHTWRRQPDIQVIDVKSNEVVEQRTFDARWKPRPWTMPLE